MVKTLDQAVLTHKLVPLLSKIRTKEPAVMVWIIGPPRTVAPMFTDGFQMATLRVQEAMGFKVDREAVAMAVLPQLWQLAMGPRVLPSFLSIKLRLIRYLNSAECRTIPQVHGGNQEARRSGRT